MMNDLALLPLSNWPSLRANDAGLICSHLQASYRPSLISFPDRPGPRFTHNQAEFGSLKFHGIHYGSRTIIKSPPSTDNYLLVIPMLGQGRFNLGKHSFTATQGDILVFNPTDLLEIELSENFVQIAIQLPKQSIHRIICEQLGYRRDNPLIFNSLNGDVAKIGPSLKAFIGLTIDDLNTHQALCKNRYAMQNTENVIISLLLDEIDNNYKAQLNSNTHICRPRYVRRAEDYIQQNYDREITIEQLAKDIGITSRSLQLGFKKHLSTTPTNYVMCVRLDKARDIFTSPSLEQQSITHVALSCGFKHLSNFIKYYKARFGETPSQTLAKTKN